MEKERFCPMVFIQPIWIYKTTFLSRPYLLTWNFRNLLTWNCLVSSKCNLYIGVVVIY